MLSPKRIRLIAGRNLRCFSVGLSNPLLSRHIRIWRRTYDFFMRMHDGARIQTEV